MRIRNSILSLGLGLAFLVTPLRAQHAIEHKYASPNIKGIDVGPYSCIIWFRNIVQTWFIESACYNGTTNVRAITVQQDDSLDVGFKFKNGYIRWIITSNPDNTITLEIGARGADDTKDLLVKETF